MDSKRQDVTDARSTEIDVVDDVGQLLDQEYTHRVRVVAKFADPMPGYVSCHHPCNIDHPVTRLESSGVPRAIAMPFWPIAR